MFVSLKVGKQRNHDGAVVDSGFVAVVLTVSGVSVVLVRFTAEGVWTSEVRCCRGGAFAGGKQWRRRVLWFLFCSARDSPFLFPFSLSFSFLLR